MTVLAWDNGRSETARRVNVERSLTTSLDLTKEGLAMHATRCSVEGCNRPHEARGFCGMHYMRVRTRGTTDDPPRKPTLLERFMSHVAVDANGCWLWTGRPGTGGYGYFGQKVDGVWKNRRAHRVSYELHVGPIPDGLQIHHRCETPPCVNPDHLEPMTGRENTLISSGVAAQNARRTECLRGHPLDGDNLQLMRTDGSVKRRCKTCARIRRAASTPEKEQHHA